MQINLYLGACAVLAIGLLYLQPPHALSAALISLAWLGLCGLCWPKTQRRPLKAQTLYVAYASQGGKARELAQRSAKQLQQAQLKAEAIGLEQLDLDTLSDQSQLLFVLSTYGTGEAPDHAAHFARQISHSQKDLSQLNYAVLALGDRSYPEFCGFAQQIEQQLSRLGAQALYPTLNVDRLAEPELRQWQQQLAHLSGTQPLQPWMDEPYQTGQLLSREPINNGSQGAPLWLIRIACAQSWQAGDIAEILARPLDSNATSAPRDYSIASLPSTGELQLIVREQYARDGRLGLGSGWLCRYAQIGEMLQLRIRSNPSFQLPKHCGRLILLGNGSGLAGLLAHLHEREQLNQHGHWLIFGERNAASDTLFEAQLNHWLSSGHLAQLDRVFSRDGQPQRYVQECLAAHAAQLQDWLNQGATLLVCGSLEGMGRAVEQLLQQLLGPQQVQQLQAQGRYRRDVY